MVDITAATSKLGDCKATLSAEKAENMQLKRELEAALRRIHELERILNNIHKHHSKR